MTLAAYLERIGLPPEGIGVVDEAGLRRVAAAHAASIPFENTRAHRGERISVAIEDIRERLVERREGGVCYELNGGLAWLLVELGAEVELNAAQVLAGATTPGANGLPMSHVALIVALPESGGRFLVDVGFGGETIFRSVPDDGETVSTDRGSSYRIDRRPRQLGDFEGLAWWHSTSPGSRFMQSIIISSSRADGLATLYGKDAGDVEGGERVIWYFRDAGESQVREPDATEAQAIATEVFGLTAPLPRRILRYVSAA